MDGGWTNATLISNPCGSNEAKDLVDFVKKGKLKQGQAPARAMAFSHLRMEKLAQALQDDTTTSNITISFMLATASAAFCLWLRTSESSNL